MDLSSLHYTKSHEWIHQDGDIATVGITDFAVAELTDLVFVELPELEASVTTGESCGVVESVKAASDLISPVSGVVTEVNETLEAELEKLSSSPFEDGWLFRVKLSDSSLSEDLMDRTAYEEFCNSESH